MGLLTRIVALPLAPVYGVVWVAKTLADYADEEMYGEAGIRRRLAEIEAAHAAGEISDDELDRAEREALALLAERRRGGGHAIG